MKTPKRVHYFGKTKTEGSKEMKDLLGGKGANLAEMTAIGLPVPPGFTIDTKSCADYNEMGGMLPAGLMDEVKKNMGSVEQEIGKRFGAEDDPLLVSVRSGAAVSMPGMMDTVLNLGLTDQAVEGLARISGNRRFALDAYRRLINMFGDVVMGVHHEKFEAEFDRVKAEFGVVLDTELNESGLEKLIEAYKSVYRQGTGEEFPQDPYLQLEKSIEAVFKSWNIPRAVRYRQINEITGLLGTAVNVQTMVFGNMGQDSGTGVAFTRNPSTGLNEFYGEFLVNAQGEDVVAGIRTPQPVEEMVTWRPDIHAQLLEIKQILENHYLSHPIQPTEGALEVFNWLRRQDIKIALTTGFYRKVCNIILHRLGWDAGLDEHYLGGADSIIQLSLTPDETDKGRPHPDMIWKAMEMLDVADAGQVIKVGDTPSDLQAGRAAGCGLTLGVTNGTHTHQELAAHPNDGLLPSMKAFVSFL